MEMEFAVRLHTNYTSILMRTVRLLFFALFFSLIFFQASEHVFPRLPLFFFGIFFMIEIFFRLHIERLRPGKVVTQNTGDVMDSFTRQAITPFLIEDTTNKIINDLIKFPLIQRLLAKLAIKEDEIVLKEVGRELLAKTAFEAAKTRNGVYVTTLDIFAAYLFLTEQQTKLLFIKQIKQEDVFVILRWLLKENSIEEQPKSIRVHFAGAGIGEGLIAGWTPETQKYTSNFTLEALKED